jgi:hypothetical protein
MPPLSPSRIFRSILILAALTSFAIGCPPASNDDDDSTDDDDSSCVRCACDDAGASLTVVSGCAEAWWPDAATCDGGWATLLGESGMAVGDDFCSGATLENTGVYPCEIAISCE